MVDVRHGVKKIGAGLQAEFDIALEFFENLLLELVDGALALEQVADEEKSKRAETEEGNAKSPFVGGVWMDEDKWVHEYGQAAGQHEDENGGHDGELKFTALEAFEFFPIDSCHNSFHLTAERRAAPEKAIRSVLKMVAGRDGWRNRSGVLK